jgi:hypothetical protein
MSIIDCIIVETVVVVVNVVEVVMVVVNIDENGRRMRMIMISVTLATMVMKAREVVMVFLSMLVTMVMMVNGWVDGMIDHHIL